MQGVPSNVGQQLMNDFLNNSNVQQTRVSLKDGRQRLQSGKKNVKHVDPLQQNVINTRNTIDVQSTGGAGSNAQANAMMLGPNQQFAFPGGVPH